MRNYLTKLEVKDWRLFNMSADNRGVSPEAMEALRKQMESAKAEQTPASAQSPQQQPQQSTPNTTSATAALREQMISSKANSGQTVVLEQGMNYTPNEQETQQTNNGASTTIINTTKVPQDNGEDDVTGKGFKPTKTFVMIAAGVIVLGLIIFIVFASNAPEEDIPNIPEEELQWILPDSQYSYTVDQIDRLRVVGYTGREIEEFETLQMDINELVKEATAKRDAWVQEAIAPLYDSTSQEYKDFISQTWLTLPKRNDTDDWENIAGYHEVRKNLDYAKVETYGNQLYIKVYLDDNEHNDWFFLNVTPEDWVRLKDTGNVIVTYTYCTRYLLVGQNTLIEDFENIFITAAHLEIIE